MADQEIDDMGAAEPSSTPYPIIFTPLSLRHSSLFPGHSPFTLHHSRFTTLGLGLWPLDSGPWTRSYHSPFTIHDFYDSKQPSAFSSQLLDKRCKHTLDFNCLCRQRLMSVNG
jgi:hypothetical protein